MEELLKFEARATIGINIFIPPKYEFVFYNDKLIINKKNKLAMEVNYAEIKEISVVKNWQNNVLFSCKPHCFNIYDISDELCNKIKEITGK